MKSKAKAKRWTFHETSQIGIWADSESSLVYLFSTTKSNVELNIELRVERKLREKVHSRIAGGTEREYSSKPLRKI